MPLSNESMALRSQGVGASEAAAVLGMHPYISPHQVWARKIGIMSEPELEDNHHVQRGIYLEPALIRWYEARTGLDVRYTGRHQKTHVHPERTLCRATPDGLIGSKGTLEAKATWYWNAREWGDTGTDLVPQHVYMQCLWQLGATGRQFTDCIGMTPDGDLGIWQIQFDPAVFFHVYDRVEAWWHNHVVPRVAPPPDASSGCAEALLAEFPAASGKSLVEDDAELDAKAAELRKAHEALQRAENEYKTLSNAYKALLGDEYGAKTPSGKILWYNCKGRARVDWKSIAASLGEVPSALIEQYTKQSPDYRVFRPYWAKEEL